MHQEPNEVIFVELLNGFMTEIINNNDTIQLDVCNTEDCRLVCRKCNICIHNYTCEFKAGIGILSSLIISKSEVTEKEVADMSKHNNFLLQILQGKQKTIKIKENKEPVNENIDKQKLCVAKKNKVELLSGRKEYSSTIHPVLSLLVAQHYCGVNILDRLPLVTAPRA
ncbi:hypothetical protein QTP88_012764 [Uroleucon formosanum]